MRTRRGQFGKMRAQLGIGKHHVNAAVMQDVTHLGRFQKIVDGHNDGARVQNAKDR